MPFRPTKPGLFCVRQAMNYRIIARVHEALLAPHRLFERQGKDAKPQAPHSPKSRLVLDRCVTDLCEACSSQEVTACSEASATVAKPDQDGSRDPQGQAGRSLRAPYWPRCLIAGFVVYPIPRECQPCKFHQQRTCSGFPMLSGSRSLLSREILPSFDGRAWIWRECCRLLVMVLGHCVLWVCV